MSGQSSSSLSAMDAKVATEHSWARLPLKADDYFLSADNPLATADQRDLEIEALEIIQAPAVKQAKAVARGRWKTIIASLHPDEEAWTRFDAFLDEFIYHYTLKALNSDPNYPRVVRYNMLPHTWFGRSIPGTRQGGGDNWDNAYALIPVEHGASYEIEVQRFSPGPVDVTWSLMGNLMPTMTLAVLEGRDMVAGADGRFIVTVDEKPAGGRANHIQTQPDARYIFIRETRGDWKQVCAAIRAKRLTKPRMPPLTQSELIARAARYVTEEIANTFWWQAILANTPVNAMTPPAGITGLGGLVTQQVSFGRARIADDEAMVVTVTGGGAAYYSFGLYDFWFNSLDYANHSSTMNNCQAAMNADGSTTYILAHRDPGLHNWLDPAGVRSLLLVQRWQELPRESSTQAPVSIEASVVKLSALQDALPANVSRVTPEERRAQLERRRVEHDLRFAH